MDWIKGVCHQNYLYSAAAALPISLTESAHTILYIGVDEQGRVVEPKVTKSSGSPDFDRDAMSTVQRWRFKSATCDGKPVSTRINIDIESNVRK
jgi:TonB family protein